MPFYRRRYRERVHARSGRDSAWPSRYQTPGTADLIVPDRRRVKLRYYGTYPFTTAAPADQIFSGNSVFDPDATGVGAQPVGYDQWAALYGTYTVLASSIKFVITTGSSVATRCVLIPTTDTVTAATLSTIELMQNNYSKAAYLNVSTGGHDIARLKHYMSTSEIIGIPPSRVTDDPNCSASIGNNPATRWYWFFTPFAMDGSSAVILRADVCVTYYIEFWNRNDLVQS